MRLQVGKIFCNFPKITFYPNTVYSISFDNTELTLNITLCWTVDIDSNACNFNTGGLSSLDN